MSNGPIVKSSGPSGAALQAAGVALLLQAGLRAFFLAIFLLTLSANPRLSQIILGKAYLLTMSVLLPTAFAVVGVVTGIMLLARARSAAIVARAFCVIGLLVLAYGAFQIAFMHVYKSHPPPMQTYVLMALNGVIYAGTLIAVSRSA